MSIQIICRKVSGDRYMEVKVVYGETTIDLGFHDAVERKLLAQYFIQAAEELLDGLEDAKDQT